MLGFAIVGALIFGYSLPEHCLGAMSSKELALKLLARSNDSLLHLRFRCVLFTNPCARSV